MKRIFLFGFAFVASFLSSAAENFIETEWSQKVSSENLWNRYPRPQMKRSEWLNLNGEWNYAITPKNSEKPKSFEGKILVPFAVESRLSGVQRSVGADSVLWYQRDFTIPKNWKKDNILLNFGAVDWQATVWVNDILVGSHEGGYTPFSMNITDAVKKGENKLTVRVYDPTDGGTQPRGKQLRKPELIWYTPVSGIWQTVWIEPVAKNHITSLSVTPDVDANKFKVCANASAGIVKIDVLDEGIVVASGSGNASQDIEVFMPRNVKLWDTENPNIYDLKISLMKDGRIVDQIESYAAMRKIGMRPDNKGMVRFTLNDKDIFHFGPLDQGWWSDGLYTAPTYEAMVYDIDKTKELGFNMIRKHIKVEPDLWYEYCDRNGILVWQDMPSGDVCNYHWQNYNFHRGKEFERSDISDKTYRKEWREIMDALRNHPCIAVWVPFNEGWGQYNTVEIANWTKQYDPSRLVNSASGGNFFADCGDIMDVHNYPEPKIYMLDRSKANVIGEYGGIGYAVEGHLWAPERNWGYIQFKSPDEVTEEYLKYIDILSDLADIAYTGAVYTQTTDVEIEVNGLMTYDRKVMKVDPKRIAKANKELIAKFSQR